MTWTFDENKRIKKMQSFYMTAMDREAWVKQRMIDNRSYLWDWPLVLGLTMQMLFDAHVMCLKDKPRYYNTCIGDFVDEEYWMMTIPLSMGPRDPGQDKALIMDTADKRWCNRRYGILCNMGWPLTPKILELLRAWTRHNDGKLGREAI